MIFEWDDTKNKKNIKKHGISFDMAKLVFNDERSITIYDAEHSIYEDRFLRLGMVNKLICVVYVVRGDNDTVRLISARKANDFERRLYYGDIRL